MDIQTLYLGASLLGLVIINIVLGSISSLFQKQFDKVKFWQGVLKGLIVIFCFVGVVFIGRLNPNVIVINVNGQDVSLLTGTYMLMLGSYIFYGKEVLVKLSSFISGKYKIDENKEVE